MNADGFEKNGYHVTSPLLSEKQCQTLETYLSEVTISMAGSRSLLEFDWCCSLARDLKTHPHLSNFLPEKFVAAQCTFFEKSVDRNWLVSLHQDLSIPVFERIDHAMLTGWSEKEGGIFVQPPTEVLQKLVAVRLHIDECSLTDGPLKVVPGSHLYGRVNQESALLLRTGSGEVVSPVARGAAMLMRPMLLHSSSKASGQSKRRVLHFLFGPESLPYWLRWRHAA